MSDQTGHSDSQPQTPDPMPAEEADRADDELVGDVPPAGGEEGDQAAQTEAARAGEAEQQPGESDADQGEPAEEDPLAALRAERDEYLDLLRRERAEFENFRKRANKERTEALDRGAEQIMAELLLVLDNFGYTLRAAEESSDETLAKGVQMVWGQLMETLERAGLETVPGKGAAFDPTVHEAVEQVEAAEVLGSDVDEPVVAEVLRSGYRFRERLLRPASVKVAK